jgi:hypothetical protein
MIVNHAYKFIFYHVPKTGGSTVQAALSAISGSHRVVKKTKHLTPPEYLESRNLFQRWRERNYFTFCFFRDPFERFGSAHRYTYKYGAGLDRTPDVNDFALLLADRVEWVMDLSSIRPQADYCNHVQYIGRTENLNADFAFIRERSGFKAELPEPKNVSGDPIRYKDTYTTRTIDILSEFYRADIAWWEADFRD